MDLSKKLKDWSERPLRCRFGPALFWLLLLAACMAMITRGMDSDSYYMIAQGREILSNKGVPEYNSFTFYEGFRICVQQWLYCVIMTVLHDNLGKWAIILFGAAQAVLASYVFYKFLALKVKDRAIARLFGALIPVVLMPTYFFSMRPENLTYALLVLECMVLEAYRDRKLKSVLSVLPVLMLAEANLHCSMWMFHFCILAAYVVPVPLKFLKNDRIKIKWEVLYWSAVTLAMVWAQPYGTENVLYPLRSLKVFKYIEISEQISTPYMTGSGIMLLLLMLLFFYCVIKRYVAGTTFWICAGFLSLGMNNHHSYMFSVIALLFLLRDILTVYESKGPSKLMDLMPNAAWIGIGAEIMAVACMAAWAVFIRYPNFTADAEWDAMIAVMRENGIRGNIECGTNAGAYLEYHGFTGVTSDTRPELWLKSINKSYDAQYDYVYLIYGFRRGDGMNYGSPDDYMDVHDIQYVMISPESDHTYLRGWIENSDKYRLAWSSEDINGLLLYEYLPNS